MCAHHDVMLVIAMMMTMFIMVKMMLMRMMMKTIMAPVEHDVLIICSSKFTCALCVRHDGVDPNPQSIVAGQIENHCGCANLRSLWLRKFKTIVAG